MTGNPIVYNLEEKKTLNTIVIKIETGICNKVNVRESVKGKIIDRYPLKLFLDMVPSSFADNIFRGAARYSLFPPLSRVRPRSRVSRGAKAHFPNQQLGIDPSSVGDEKHVKSLG